MTAALAATLFALGLVGAFVAGLLGIGGALVMIPLLLYVPPLLGVGALDVKTVAAITMVQVFVAGVSGMLAHRRHRAVNTELVLVGGLAMAVASFAGALLSKFAEERWLLVVFAVMATAAVVLMLLPIESMEPAVPPGGFSRVRTAAISAAVGLVAGFVGAGGAFLLVPLLLVVVGVPIRVTIGSSLAITAVAATAGVAGKLITGQVPPGPAIAVALGALPGAPVGAALSRRMSGRHLKLTLLGVIALTAVRVWWDVAFP